MKIFLSVLFALLSSSVTYAQNWSEVKFGRIPLTKPLFMQGQLSKGWFNTQRVQFTLNMEPQELGAEAKDPYYSNHQKVLFQLNGTLCEGAAILTTQDEFGAKIKYSMVIYYDRDKRTASCPYHIQAYFGPMEENVASEVYTELVIYWTSDMQQSVFTGTVQKH